MRSDEIAVVEAELRAEGIMDFEEPVGPLVRQNRYDTTIPLMGGWLGVLIGTSAAFAVALWYDAPDLLPAMLPLFCLFGGITGFVVGNALAGRD